MASISRLKPGQTVWSVERGRMGNTTMPEDRVYAVVIKEVDNGQVRASWNGGPPQWFGPVSISRWRVKKPERKPNIFEQARAAVEKWENKR